MKCTKYTDQEEKEGNAHPDDTVSSNTMNSSSSPISLRTRPPIRFVHASDLHLDRGIEGVAEGSNIWEQRLLGVSRQAAERLFEKVLVENVDFLLLCGDVINANLAGPGTLLFLVEQFELLAEAGINVYWAGGEFDSPDDWPSAFPLPSNVYHFPSNSIQDYYFQRANSGSPVPLAKIVGMSRNQQRRGVRTAEFSQDSGGLFTIAVANGEVEPESLSTRRIDYWALGGTPQRSTFHGNPRKKGLDGKPIPLEPLDDQPGNRKERKDLPPGPYTVHYPGTPVGRSPKEIGVGGATLVEIHWGEDPVLTFFPTAPIRWINEQITLGLNDNAEKLVDELRNRIKNHRAGQTDYDLLINWYIDLPPGQLAANLRRGPLAADILTQLRALYGKEEKLTWSVSLTPLLPEALPAAVYDQQTILGDFLRSVKHFQANPKEIIDLETYLPKDREDHLAQELLLASKVELPLESEKEETSESPEGPKERKLRVERFRFVQNSEQADAQRRVLHEATFIGLELLGGENFKVFSRESRAVSRLGDEEEESVQ